MRCPERCPCMKMLRRWHWWWCKLWCGTRNIMKICSVLNQMLKKLLYLKSLCCWESFIDDANILVISNSCLRSFSASSSLNSKNVRYHSFSKSISSLCLFSCDSMSLVVPPASWLKAWVCDGTIFLFLWGFTTMAFFLLADTFSTLSSLFALLDSLSSSD